MTHPAVVQPVLASPDGLEQNPPERTGYPRQQAADEDARSAPEAADRETTRWPEPGSAHAPFSNGRPRDAIGLDVPTVPKVLSPAVQKPATDSDPPADLHSQGVKKK